MLAALLATLALPQAHGLVPQSRPSRSTLEVDSTALGTNTGYRPRWVPAYGSEPGVNSNVSEFVVFDDGSGPALYVGGFFQTAGGIPARGVAKWNGTEWSALGEGPGGDVDSIAVFDDGTGPALYAGLALRFNFPAPEHWVMKWNGSTWEPLAVDLDGDVEDLIAYDDGNGSCLYASGRFLNAGGEPLRYLAKWDGTGWSAVGGVEPNSVTRVLEVIDTGSGPELYVGGFFTHIGDLEVNRIAKWNGVWRPLGTGRDSYVQSITGFDNGTTGTRVYVGGGFTGGVARWNNGFWGTLGGTLDGTVVEVTTLQAYDDGTGSSLYASGIFSSHDDFARWNGGQSWTRLGSGLTNHASDMVVFDDGTGPELVLGGIFGNAGGLAVSRIATWNGSEYGYLAEGAPGLNGSVRTLARFDAGAGAELYAGGFHGSGAVARFDGSEWTPLDDAVSGPVRALVVHDDGNGEALFAGGSLFSNGSSITNVAAWNGTEWDLLNGEVDFIVQAMARFDAGAGMDLYAVGGFFGGNSRLARWDGVEWSLLGAFNNECHALTTFDDGGGTELVAAGSFTMAGGTPANRIASWNGSAWSPLGAGLGGRVNALAIFDFGEGPRLVAGGSFDTLGGAGGAPASGLASWDGLDWTPIGEGVEGAVQTLSVHDDGRGPALYVGGSFASASGVHAEGIVRFDGTTWEALDMGVHLPAGFEATSGVHAMLSFEERGRPQLAVGGDFSSAASGDSFVALWGGRSMCLDFETEDDFTTPLVDGQALSAGEEFGTLLTLTGSGPNAGAALFDSTPGGPNDPSQDPDLLAGTGNVLILQNDAATLQSVPGVYDYPNDDADGGLLRFDFVEPVRLLDVELLDIDFGEGEATFVIQIDGAGRRRTHTVPAGWTGDVFERAPGRLRLALADMDPQPGYAATVTAEEDPGFVAEDVVALEIWLGSSGAIDDLCWEPAAALTQEEAPLQRRRL